MHELYELKDKLCEELEEYGSKEMTAGSLEVIDKLAHAIKNLDKIIEAYEEEEYSSRGGMSGEGSYEGSYGGSYARGGNRGGSRAGGSMARGGRGSSREGRGGRTGANQYGSYARGGYSREGYSRNEGMIAELRELMMEAPDERSRKEFERFISKMEQM